MKPCKSEEPKNVSIKTERSKPLLKDIGGSISDTFNSGVINQAAGAMWMPAGLTEAERDERMMFAAEFMMLNKPADEIEGLLLAQMVATHAAAMECHRRAMIRDQSLEAWDRSLNAATKANRTFLQQVEALQRYRGKGSEQRVTVHHQHVNVAADQAIVGINTASLPGGGAPSKREEQPHAITDARVPPLWSADPLRQAVPIARDEG